jgi:hypothetical protein
LSYLLGIVILPRGYISATRRPPLTKRPRGKRRGSRVKRPFTTRFDHRDQATREGVDDGQPHAPETGRVRLEPQTRSERHMTSAVTQTVGGLHPELPGWTEQLATAIAASTDDHDIWIDHDDRIVVETDSSERQCVRWTKLLIVLAAACAVGWAGLVGAHRFLWSDAAWSPPPAQGPNASAGIATSNKGPRLETPPKIVRPTPLRAPAGPSLRSPTRIAHAKPSRPVPPAPSASSYAPAAPAPAASATQPPVETPLVPVPETRPTTIDGWVLREVVNGTAVLEGPDGLWRVKRGDTVPGAGQVVDIFAWGNRMIVATDKGLITTP